MLRQLPETTHPDLLVGVGTRDDAAVYRLSDDLALIQTVDCLPPIVDDPFSFGEIAVANAVSDIYAMGGRPLLGLNIVAFPANLPKQTLVEILKGGASKAREAGLLIVGGHTVDDKEPKYGLAVTGLVRPGSQITNSGAKAGDVLVLTKPIGTGIITTAGKNQDVDERVLAGAVEEMKTLNHAACDAMVKAGVNACTDVTGYGLLGHLRGMVDASGVGARIRAASVPLLDGVRKLVASGTAPGGTIRNLASVTPAVRWDASLDRDAKLLLSDAQTSGGLLISVGAVRREGLVRELERAGVGTRAIVGEIVDRDSLGGALIDVLA